MRAHTQMSATRASTKGNHQQRREAPAGKLVQGEFIAALDVSELSPIPEGCGIA